MSNLQREDLVGILNRVQGWTVAVDQKISVIAAVQAIVCGFLFSELRDWLDAEHTTTLIKVLVFAGGGLLLVGIGFSLRASFPVIEGARLKSVTFFGTIASWSPAEYQKRLEEMTDDDWKAGDVPVAVEI